MSTFFKKYRYAADGTLLMTTIFWGLGFVFTKNGLDHLTPMMLMAIRFVFSAVGLAIIFGKRLQEISRKELLGGSLIGVFLFLGFTAQTIGLIYTTASKNAFITGTTVVIVPILAMIIFRKFLGWHVIIAAIMAVVGLGLLTVEDGTLSSINIGDWLTLLCAFFYACQVILISIFVPKSDPIILSVIQITSCAVLFVVSALIFEPIPESLSAEGLWAILYLAVFSTVFAFIMQNMAQKYVPPSHAALILSLEGVFGTFFAYLFLGEILTKQMLFGCALLLLAILIAESKLELPNN